MEKNEPKLSVSDIEQAKTPPEILVEQKDNYEINKVGHELVSKYQPKFLAKGGEHIVYEIPGHPDIVVKVATELLKKVIEWNAEHGQPIDSLPAELESRAREYIKQDAANHQQLKKYFGTDHVPNQKQFLLKIPITGNILNALYEGKPPAMTNEAWSVVKVQKRVEALNDPNRFGIIAGHTDENGKMSENLFNQTVKQFISGKNLEEKIEKEKLVEIQLHDNIRVLLEKSASDENLRESLRELVERIILYTEEVGEIIDLAGQDNVILYQKDGKWTYTLVDAGYSNGNKIFEEARATLHKLSLGNEIDEQEKHILLNVLYFVMTINVLAEQVGVQKRINIVPAGMKQEVMDLLKAINND